MVLSRRRLLQGSMICAAGMMQAPSTAATLLKQRILMVPNTDFSRAVLASALGHLGEIEEARRVWNELMAINSHYTFANHYARAAICKQGRCPQDCRWPGQSRSTALIDSLAFD